MDGRARGKRTSRSLPHTQSTPCVRCPVSMSASVIHAISPNLKPGKEFQILEVKLKHYTPDDPYYRLEPVHTCLYVRVT